MTRKPSDPITLRGGTYHLRRRVPLRYASVEPRKVISLSLNTDSPKEAGRKAAEIWHGFLEAWEIILSGDVSTGRAKLKAMENIAARYGFPYRTQKEIADPKTVSDEELISRVEVVPEAQQGVKDRIAAALLGGVEEVGLTVTDALEEFWKITVDHTRGKTPDQIRRWENPRKKAIENFVSVVGNRELRKITREDAKKFRDWWNARIDAERLSANSANKDFTHLAHTLNTVNDALGLGLALPLNKLTIKETEKGQRKAFSVKWIKDRLLAPGALDGLNLQARTIVLTCVNTGARPSEIAGLLKHHVHPDGPVPYIEVRPEGRQLKNAASARRIPLVGVSLDAVKAWVDRAPKGDKLFPDYFGRDKISATANKFLRENKLLETPQHSLYGLRHSFEDRMTAAEPAWPERMKCDVFGHAIARERYGDGATLEHIHRRLSEIAL